MMRVRDHPIRWIGAYSRGETPSAVAEFEANPRRIVSAAWGKSALSKVGLLVNQARTKCVQAWDGDAWTPDSSKRGAREKFAHNYGPGWRAAERARDAASRLDCPYAELRLAHPVYAAVVVVKGAGETAWVFAHALSERLGIPIFTIRAETTMEEDLA